MKDKLNQRLLEFGQELRVIEKTQNYLKLNNGIELSDNNLIRFCRRVLTSKHSEFVSRIDDLMSGKITEGEIKSILAARGGKACQTKHGSKIRQK